MTGRAGPERVAAIDCGTNSIRLLIAERDHAGRLVDLDRRLEIVRLGQGVDATGEFHPDALTRTFAAVDQYAEAIAAAGVGSGAVRLVATSAARDAGNRAQFFDGVRERLGVLPDILSGDQEAKLSFTGAISRLGPAAEPVLVMDIGGGSTELVVGHVDGRVDQAVSLDVGSVRLTERVLRQSPPDTAALLRATALVDEQLARSGLPFGTVATWVGVAGTVTTLAAVHLGLESYDRDVVHGARLPHPALAWLLHQLCGLGAAEIRALPSMHPQRADVITAGALIANRVGELVRQELVVSESDILDGVALDLLQGPAG